MGIGRQSTDVSRQHPYKRVTKLKVLVKSDQEGKSAVNEMEREMNALRPRVRADCLPGGINDQRPCPWYGCDQHLGLDINEATGSLMVRDVDQMVHTCTLDVAEFGGVTLEEIGEIMELTRERIRQIEVKGLLMLKPMMVAGGVAPDGHDRKFDAVSSKITDDESKESYHDCETPPTSDDTPSSTERMWKSLAVL